MSALASLLQAGVNFRKNCQLLQRSYLPPLQKSAILAVDDSIELLIERRYGAQDE